MGDFISDINEKLDFRYEGLEMKVDNGTLHYFKENNVKVRYQRGAMSRKTYKNHEDRKENDDFKFYLLGNNGHTGDGNSEMWFWGRKNVWDKIYEKMKVGELYKTANNTYQVITEETPLTNVGIIELGATLIRVENLKTQDDYRDTEKCIIGINPKNSNPEQRNIFRKIIEKDLEEENKKMQKSDTEAIKIKDILKKLDANGRKAIVLHGAPGTGKTYSVKKYVEEETGNDENRYKFVQFHQSYDYSDFVEGLRPVEIEGTQHFVRIDGTFKKFCRTIVERNLEKAKEAIATEDRENITNEEVLKAIHIYEKNKDDEEEIKNKLEKQCPKFEYNIVEELAKRFKNEKNKYYFIIDEINRADLSKVFGELMFGIEEEYRGIGHRFDTQYMNLTPYKINEAKDVEKMDFDCFRDGFFIPENLILLGTMNDIDRSVEAFDFALRRRFYWYEVKADRVMKKVLEGMYDGCVVDNELLGQINAMNDKISSEFGLTEAHHIGPAYFKTKKGSDEEKPIEDLKKELGDIFDNNIEPILREYIRGRDKNKVDKFIENCRNALLRK